LPNKLLYTFGRIFVRAYARMMLRLDIHWHDALPSGPKLFVANHPSATDPFLIHLVSPQPMSVMITVNAFTVPMFGYFLCRLKQIPVGEEGGGASLGEARCAIERGHSVAIFPEGQFSPQGGGFHSPCSGAARLALATGVPVIPVGIYLPRERSVRITSGISGKQTTGYWYLRGPYSITVGRPLNFTGDIKNREYVQSVSHAIMRHIHFLAYESEQRTRRRKLKLAGSPA